MAQYISCAQTAKLLRQSLRCEQAGSAIMMRPNPIGLLTEADITQLAISVARALRMPWSLKIIEAALRQQMEIETGRRLDEERLAKTGVQS